MQNAKTADAAAWIPERLHPFALDVGSIIPVGFAAYALVFHPFYRWTSTRQLMPVRWGDIAAANNRTIAEEMQNLDGSVEPTQFSPSGEELWNQQSRTGSMPRELAVHLIPILKSHTRTPELCWFAAWNGWGGLRSRIRDPEAAMFSVPNRDLFLLHGPIGDVLTTLLDIDWIYQSPTLWWPDDRVWCVATEIDFTWSYVGGSTDCIEQILSDPELETILTAPTQGNFMQE